MVSVVTTLVFTPSLFSSAEQILLLFLLLLRVHWILGPHPSGERGADAAKLARRPKQSPPPSEKGEERLCALDYVQTSTGSLAPIL